MKKLDFIPHLDESLNLVLSYQRPIYYQRLLVYLAGMSWQKFRIVMELDYIKVSFGIPASNDFYDKVIPFLQVKQDWE